MGEERGGRRTLFCLLSTVHTIGMLLDTLCCIVLRVFLLGNDVGNDMEGETGKCAAVLYNVGLLWGPRLWHVMVVGWRASNCRCQNTAKTCLHPCESRKK